MKYSLFILSPALLLPALLSITSCSGDMDTRAAHTISKPDSAVVIQAGNEVIIDAFASISNALGTAMSRGGIPHAIEYCNLNAITLTDSVSREYDVEIRRASHKPRNPQNRANDEEMASIEAFIQMINEGRELSPRLIYGEDKVTYHSPLRLVAYTCLSCHGEKSDDIRDDDLMIIDRHYPQDEATGFELDELRGIWSVKFPYTFFETGTIDP
jgi:hypothetical protein